MTLSKPWLDSSAGSSAADVDVERQQVADGVLVLGAVQPAEGVGPAGIGVRRGGAVERGLERRDDGLVRRLVRPRLADGRHLPRAQLPDDLLPGDGVRGDVARHDRLERQVGFLRPVVVAVQAVLLDQVAGRRNGGAGARHGCAGRVCSQPQATGRHEAGQSDHRRGPARVEQGHSGE